MTAEEYCAVNNVRFKVQNDLPHKIRGFVIPDYDGTYTVVLNGRLSVTQQRKTADHELRHILRGDCFNTMYNEYGD